MKIIKALKKRVNGRALYLAIIISFISAVLAFSFLLFKHYKYVQLANIQAVQRINDDINSALVLMMNNEEEISGEKILTLFNDSLNTLEVGKRNWGVYGIAWAKTQWKFISESKMVMFGNKAGGIGSTGLYLADHGHYLAVGGDSYLSGICYFPTLGARKAYIDGQSFKYQSIVNGEIKTSNKKLPILSDKLLRYFKENLFQINNTTDSLMDENIFKQKMIFNSFYNKTLIISSMDTLNLSGIQVIGNIIIQSASKIKIAKSFQSDNIICVAPKIEVSDNFEGIIQLFATDTIIVGNEVKIKYPGSLVVAGFDRSTVHISVGKKSRIEGTVIAFADIEVNNNVSVTLDKDVEVYGMVYCNGKISLSSKIYGGLYCDMIFLQTNQGYYENHLLNTWVDPGGLEPDFATGPLFDNSFESTSKRIIQCLE